MSTIEAKNISLDYPLLDYSGRNIRNAILNSIGGLINRKRTVPSVKALDNLSFCINEKERVGLIGHNGSGKSTLLKVLAGIYQPEGKLNVQGQTSALLDLNLSFNQELTGYENILISLYLTHKDYKLASARMEHIAQYSELGDYLVLPIRTYSAGMRLRLGMAIALDIEPDILLIDEVFAAGDINFQQKTEKTMLNLIEKSKILVISCHSEELINRFCNRKIRLGRGKIIEDSTL